VKDDRRFCAGETVHGRQCRRRANRGAYCLRHDPTLSDDQRARLMFPLSPTRWPSYRRWRWSGAAPRAARSAAELYAAFRAYEEAQR